MKRTQPNDRSRLWLTERAHGLEKIFLMGRSYWDQMQDFLKETLLAEGTIDPDDQYLFHVTDDPRQALDIIIQKTTINRDINNA